MGSVPDTIFSRTLPPIRREPVIDVDDSVPIGHTVMLRKPDSDPKWERLTARRIVWDETDEVLRFGKEIAIWWGTIPMLVEVTTPPEDEAARAERIPGRPAGGIAARKASTILMINRLVAYTEDVSVKGKSLVVATWPYANGFVDHMSFKGSGGEAKGHPDTLPRWQLTAKPTPLGRLHDLLRRFDKMPYDYFLTDSRLLSAGKFLWKGPLNYGEMRYYRKDLDGSPPRWVFGISDDFDEDEARLTKHLDVVASAAAHAGPPAQRHPWTKEEKDTLKDVAPSVAGMAIRLSLAGYRDEVEIERVEGSDVIECAKQIARDLAGTFMNIDLDTKEREVSTEGAQIQIDRKAAEVHSRLQRHGRSTQPDDQ